MSRNWRSHRMAAVAGVLALIWLIMVLIAVIGLVRGHLHWARPRSRKHAGWLLAASFVVFFLIGLTAPDQKSGDAEQKSPPSSAPALPTTMSSPVTSAPVSSSPVVSAAPVAPATTTVPAAPTSFSPAPPVPPLPSTRVPAPQPFVAPPTAESTTPPPAPARVHYADCDAVRAAGAAPLHRGEPGYRSGLDRDNDGIACDR
ncbi:excalibur calcium-binding domain-containing protein [Nocardia sp. NPDC048505]|uniref:excalibur calcium-binding domain-containing protein n=1 Tax=Nocardia sp. NPDC048505 TaxID=3155756 RepID=UPI0033CDCA40